VPGVRGACGQRERGPASDATPLARSRGGSGAGRWGGGPELGGAAGGGDLRAGRAAGEGERVQRALGLLGGLVVLQGVAELAACQPAGMGLEGGVDLFGERVAGRALQRPAGGAGGVVGDRERCLEVLAGDPAGVVGERVDQREPNRVRFGARADLADDPEAWLGEVGVGLPPQRTGRLIEAELSGGSGLVECRLELLV
jgi:hypothetical protein